MTSSFCDADFLIYCKKELTPLQAPRGDVFRSDCKVFYRLPPKDGFFPAASFFWTAVPLADSKATSALVITSPARLKAPYSNSSGSLCCLPLGPFGNSGSREQVFTVLNLEKWERVLGFLQLVQCSPVHIQDAA